MRVKEESERDSLRLNIKKTKVIASGPSTAWQIEGEGITDSKNMSLSKLRSW